MEEQGSYKHPEWRRLYESVKDTAKPGDFYDYPVLKLLSGVDVQTSRGRAQFQRFAQELLEKNSLHLENVRKQGYRVVEANEHAICSTERVRKAKRQMRRAGRIAIHVRYELLTPDELRRTTDVASRVARLERVVSEHDRVIRKLAAGAPLKRLPHPLRGDEEGGKPVQ